MSKYDDVFSDAESRLSEEIPNSRDSEFQKTIRFYEIYTELASERKGRIHTTLPKTNVSSNSIMSHSNFKHFNNARKFCDEGEIDYRLWIKVQFYMCSNWDEYLKSRPDGVPSPWMLHGDGAERRYKWFLDKQDKIGEKYGSDLSKLEVRKTWEGPVNLALFLKKLLDRGEKIDYNSVFLTVVTFPGMWEAEYLLHNQSIRDELLEYNGEVGKVCRETQKTLKNKGKTYREKLLKVYERSLMQVKKRFPKEFKTLIKWL